MSELGDENTEELLDENDTNGDSESEEDVLSLDAVALMARGARRGSRFAADGTPLFLRAYLESASSELHFFFHFRTLDLHFQPVEDHLERRVPGTKMRFEMTDGQFQMPEGLTTSATTCPTRRDKKRHTLADLYVLQPHPDLTMYVGIMPGRKVPVITDLNPYQEGLVDHRKALFLPYSEDKNFLMELPNSPGVFFTSQLVCSGEIAVAYDRSLHKYWVVVINQAYSPPKFARLPEGEVGEETCWRRAVDCRAYLDKVLSLATTFGSKLELQIRVSPATPFMESLDDYSADKIHPAQMRLDNYFRDELDRCHKRTRFYYYQEDVMLYGFNDENNWEFGLKDRCDSNGFAIYKESPQSLNIKLKPASFPI